MGCVVRSLMVAFVWVSSAGAQELTPFWSGAAPPPGATRPADEPRDAAIAAARAAQDLAMLAQEIEGSAERDALAALRQQVEDLSAAFQAQATALAAPRLPERLAADPASAEADRERLSRQFEALRPRLEKLESLPRVSKAAQAAKQSGDQALEQTLEATAGSQPPYALDVACNQLYTSDVPRSLGQSELLEALASILAELDANQRDVESFVRAAKFSVGLWPSVTVKRAGPAGDGAGVSLGRERTLWLVGACAEMLGWRRAEQSLEGTEGHRRLASQHLSLRNLRRWQGKLNQGSTSLDLHNASAEIRVREAKNALEDVLRSHELLNLFSASLLTGGVIADAGQVRAPATAEGAATENGNGERAAPVENTQTYLTNVSIETGHFGWDGRRALEASLRAKLGFQPALTLVQRSAAIAAGEGGGDEGAGEADLSSQQQQAFAWTLGPHVHFRLSDINAEWGGFLRVGATHLVNDVTLVDRGEDRSYVAIPAGMADRTAWVFETGVDFNLFDNPLALIHLEKTPPQFTISAGYRRDARFLPEGLLATFDTPHHRFFFRFMIDALKTIDRRRAGELAKPLDFGFGIEYDRAFFRLADPDEVPASTRIIVRGNINLLRALRGEQTQDAPAVAEGGHRGGTTQAARAPRQ